MWRGPVNPLNESERQAIAEAVAQRLEIAAAPRPLLTLSEVAELLRCSDKSIRRMVKDGRLTAFKVAERIVFRSEEIEDLVKRCRVNYLN